MKKYVFLASSSNDIFVSCSLLLLTPQLRCHSNSISHCIKIHVFGETKQPSNWMTQNRRPLISGAQIKRKKKEKRDSAKAAGALKTWRGFCFASIMYRQMEPDVAMGSRTLVTWLLSTCACRINEPPFQETKLGTYMAQWCRSYVWCTRGSFETGPPQLAWNGRLLLWCGYVTTPQNHWTLQMHSTAQIWVKTQTSTSLT